MGKTNTRAHADWARLENLFTRYLQSDAEATRTLFLELLRVVQGFFRIRMGSSADSRGEVEDLAQATLLKIHFARDRYDSSRSLKTWVFTIATRSLIDHWRGSSIEAEILTSEYAGADQSSSQDGDLSPSDLAVSELLDPERKTELHQDLNQALMKLKPMERSIVYLYGVEGLSMAEIGEALLITEGAAKLRAHRAYQELRKTLGIWAALAFGLHFWMEYLWT